MSALYENIKRICRDKHMTVFGLERAAGLPYNSIPKWQKHSPGIDKVAKVAAALQVTIDELMKGEA